MNKIDLIDRLIDDLKKFVKAKSIVRSHEQFTADRRAYALSIIPDMDYSIEESWIALTCDVLFPGQLTTVVNFMNYFDPIIDKATIAQFSTVYFLQQIEEKKFEVSDCFKKIKTSTNLVFVTAQNTKPIFYLLKKRLDDIHNDALIIDNCYSALVQKRNKK